MTDTLTIPDEIVLLGAYLRPLISPLPIGPDMGSTEDGKKLARVRITRIGGTPDQSGPLWVDRPIVAFESWGPVSTTVGDGAQVARANAETIRRLLQPELICGTHATGVISGVVFRTLYDDPDDRWGGNVARARTRFDIELSVHPKPA